MAIDPRNLRPADLVRLLNSTALGTVINERQLDRHRMETGFRIGDGKRMDFLRYVAWLVEVDYTPKPGLGEGPAVRAGSWSLVPPNSL